MQIHLHGRRFSDPHRISQIREFVTSGADQKTLVSEDGVNKGTHVQHTVSAFILRKIDYKQGVNICEYCHTEFVLQGFVVKFSRKGLSTVFVLAKDIPIQ